MKKILLLIIIYLKLIFPQEENFDKNKLPFDFLQYQLWSDRYSHGETDEKPYVRLSNDDSMGVKLSRIYLKKWDNDTIPLGYLPVELKSDKFQLYVFGCRLKDKNIPSLIYRIITVNNNNEIIGGITAVVYSEKTGDWKQESFYISENLEITLYKNKTDQTKVLSSKVAGKYRIKEDGKFEKIQ